MMEKEGIIQLFEGKTLFLKKTETVAVEKRPDEESGRKSKFTVEGNNRKNTAVVYSYPGEISPVLRELAMKMLTAVQLNREDVLLINLQGRPDREIKSMAARFLAFGNDALFSLNEDATLYEVLQEEEITYVIADELHIISDQMELKKKLWKSMQVLFPK